MIIDAHHHLWRYNQKEYGWIDNSMTMLQRDYLPYELEQEMRKSGVEGSVVVQARQSIEETSWLLNLADKHPSILGVVGWLDLLSPDLESELEEFAAYPKLVGLRHVLHDEPDGDFMLRPEFKRGIAQLEEHDLTYDLLLFPSHLSHAIELVEEFPGQQFVLDHLGKPSIKAGAMEPWAKDIARLAEHSNVWCKLSGMVSEADMKKWKYEDLLPYMKVVLSAFGTDRIMLGSDWPVCRLAGEYNKVMAVFSRFIEHFNEEDKEKISYQNAIDCYQLQIEN